MNKVEISGVNTAKLPLLSSEEKLLLMKEIKNGNEDARQKFINGNLRLVLSIIKRFNSKGENLDDLFQVGCVGLIKVRDNNSIRVSRSVRDLAYKVIGIKDKIYKEEQREVSIDEISKELGVSREDIIMSLDAIQEPISLQEPAYSENTENIYIMDQVSDKKNTDELWAQNLTISEAMKKLNEKEKMIINKRFFEGRTQMEVAEEIGISQAQVSRLERTAIGHIRRIYK